MKVCWELLGMFFVRNTGRKKNTALLLPWAAVSWYRATSLRINQYGEEDRIYGNYRKTKSALRDIPAATPCFNFYYVNYKLPYLLRLIKLGFSVHCNPKHPK